MDNTDMATVVTVEELLAEQARMEREAARVLPGDHDKCTYIEGVPCDRQRIYACRTCVPPSNGKTAGVCYSCSISCHSDHDLIELFTKRDFTCDCGNTLFSGLRCTLTPNKTPTNNSNYYNHNFFNRYCRCDQPYDPANEQDTMMQCSVCEDWFHNRCLFQAPANDTFSLFVCGLCMRNRPTLRKHRHRPDIVAGFEKPQAVDTQQSKQDDKIVVDVTSNNTDTDTDGEPASKRLKLSCLVEDVPADVNGDVDFYLSNNWEASLCLCDACKVFLNSELEDLRQFEETIGRPEFNPATDSDDEDDPIVLTSDANGEVNTTTASATAIVPTTGNGEVTSVYDLGVAALQTRPFHEQQVLAAAIANMVNVVKSGLQDLRNSGVTEITQEHIEAIAANFRQRHQ